MERRKVIFDSELKTFEKILSSGIVVFSKKPILYDYEDTVDNVVIFRHGNSVFGDLKDNVSVITPEAYEKYLKILIVNYRQHDEVIDELIKDSIERGVDPFSLLY